MNESDADAATVIGSGETGKAVGSVTSTFVRIEVEAKERQKGKKKVFANKIVE